MWLHVFGRLRPGVSAERAQADANVIFKQGLGAYTDPSPTRRRARRSSISGWR